MPFASCDIKLHYNFPYFPAHLTFISAQQSQLFNSGNPSEQQERQSQLRAWQCAGPRIAARTCKAFQIDKFIYTHSHSMCVCVCVWGWLCVLVCFLLESHCGSACSTASTSCIAFVLTILITAFISASACLCLYLPFRCHCIYCLSLYLILGCCLSVPWF